MSQIGVCMITINFHPFIGGAEMQTKSLATWLVNHGLPTMVITRRLPGTSAYEVLDGVEVYRVPLLPTKAGEGLSFIVMSLLRLLLERKRYDVIHSHIIFSPTTIGWIAKKLLNKPLVVNLHRGGAEGDMVRLIKKMGGDFRMKRFARDADAFIAISEEIGQELQAHQVSPDKIHYLGNGVDTNIFKPVDAEQQRQLRVKLNLPLDVPIVTFVGRHIPIKGIDVLLKAWQQVPAPAHLVVVGDGPQHNELKSIAAETLPGRVTFPGQSDKVYEYLQASTAWTLPSYGEGLPVSMLEAMACSLPVVVTKIAAMGELIQPGVNGYTIEPGNADALAKALTDLTQNPDQAQSMGATNLQFVKDRFSIDAVSQSYVDLYKKLVGAAN